MPRHLWKHKGIEFNFCIKCGMKKDLSVRSECQVYNLNNRHPHDIIINKHKCRKCNIGKWQTIFSNQPGAPAYVPYKIFEVKNKDGTTKKVAKHMRYFKKRGKKEIGLVDVAFWPIYCGLSEDEWIAIDIIT